MVYGLFQPTQNDFVKQLLVLFVIILASIPKVYADDDDWIDGITFRITESRNSLQLYLDGVDSISMVATMGSDEPQKLYFDHLSGKKKYLSPITIEFKETLMSSWSYRSAYLDWEINHETNDLPPNSPDEVEFTTRTSTSQYLRQPATLRDVLIDEFFNSSEKEFTDANPNWALSADSKISTIIIGYYWGVFLPAFEYHRFLKIGFGIGAYAAQFKIDYNLCSAYIVTEKYDEGGKREVMIEMGDFPDIIRKPHTGECEGKKKIDTLEKIFYGTANLFDIVIWERKTKDSIWRILGSKSATTYPFGNKIEAFRLKDRSTFFVPSLDIGSITIFSYTYLF